jgi:hypothetical protein
MREVLLPLHLFTFSLPWSAVTFAVNCGRAENRSMSAFRGNPENICSIRVLPVLTRNGRRCVSTDSH